MADHKLAKSNADELLAGRRRFAWMPENLAAAYLEHDAEVRRARELLPPYEDEAGEQAGLGEAICIALADHERSLARLRGARERAEAGRNRMREVLRAVLDATSKGPVCPCCRQALCRPACPAAEGRRLVDPSEKGNAERRRAPRGGRQ